MEQHPVPQHIASYEFRLVGDMTLKQFLQVAAGGLVALLFYASPIPGIIKWPAILISGLVGTAFAFLPFEERPLSVWVATFIKAIYSPTQYYFQQGSVRDIFAPEQTPGPEGLESRREETPSIISQEGTVISQFEEKEQTYFQKVVSLFPHVQIPQKIEPATTFTGQEPIRPQMVIEEEKPELKVPESKPVEIPRAEPFGLAGYRPVVGSAQSGQAAQVGEPAIIKPTLTGQRTETGPAKFAISAAPPAPPNIPNVIVGQVMDNEGKFVDGAILEVRDREGRPVRALRTNKVGHFLTATPLASGVYEIITERDGFEFAPIKFQAVGGIILPIQIMGQRLDSFPPPPPGGKKLSYPA